MTNNPQLPAAVAEFIQNAIDSVPELEALLLFFRDPAAVWPEAGLAARLYVSVREAQAIIGRLARGGFLAPVSGGWSWSAQAPRDLVAQVEEAYRTRLTLVTRIIHAKPPSAVRDFARAFDVRREK